MTTAAPVVAVVAWGRPDHSHSDPGDPFDPWYGEEEAAAAIDSYVTGALRAGAIGVAVMRGEAAPPPRGNVERVIVGIDGSHAAQGALRWALAGARLRPAAIELVHVRDRAGGDGDAPADQLLDEALAGEDLSGLASPVGRVLVDGRPSEALLSAASTADVVVLGTRAGSAGRSLGSVSYRVMHHAPCSVVVVPYRDGILGRTA